MAPETLAVRSVIESRIPNMQWKFILGLIQMKGLTNVQFVTKNIHKVALEIGIFTACIRIILLDNAHN